MKFCAPDYETGYTTFKAASIDELAKKLAYDHERYNLNWEVCTVSSNKIYYFVYSDGSYDKW